MPVPAARVQAAARELLVGEPAVREAGLAAGHVEAANEVKSSAAFYWVHLT